MCYLSYGETPLVNCGPQSNFLYIAILFYYYSHCLLSCITIIQLPLDTLNPLFTANRWDWQPHRKLGAKFLVVLCAGFMLLLGEDTLTSSCIWRPCPECHEASKHHLLKFGFLLLVWLNLCFTTEGRLGTVLIIPSSLGSQQAVLTSHQAVFWRRCRGERRPLQGESRTHNLYFVIVLLYFILFTCIILSKIQKKISFLYSCYFITLSSLCCSLSMFWRTSQ
jgi:hypothetical protein